VRDKKVEIKAKRVLDLRRTITFDKLRQGKNFG
jgi:hypothetical protein